MKLNLGNHIRTNRRRMNLTQEQLAEKLGTSAQTVSRWENGVTYPDLEMLPIMASFFGVSVDSLLSCTEEEKKVRCDERTNEFKNAIHHKDTEKLIEILLEIRRNLREYNHYWFWGLFEDVFYSELYKNEKVLNEIRLLSDEIFMSCSKENYEEIVGWMANMEDEEHIDAFLDANASREDFSRTELLMQRYKMRGETEKYEPVRQTYLWYHLANIVDKPIVWKSVPVSSAEHNRWYCETQLRYINKINGLSTDSAHIVSGTNSIDLWCMERIHLGLKLANALYCLGENEYAHTVFDDLISLLEKIMSISDKEEFKLYCSCPALSDFYLKSKFHWLKRNGREYKALEMTSGEWSNWISPNDYLAVTKNPSCTGYAAMRKDARFFQLFERLENCVILRNTHQK